MYGLRAGTTSCMSQCAHKVLQSSCHPRKFSILGIIQHAGDSDVTFSEFVIRPGLLTMAETQTRHYYIKN